MAQYTNTTQIQAVLKDTFSKKGVIDLKPNSSYFGRNVPFSDKAERNGNIFHQPVALSGVHGWTFVGPTDAVATLNTPVAPTYGDAQVQGYEVDGRMQMTYQALARLQTPSGAFEDAVQVRARDLMKGAWNLNEKQLLYARTGYGSGASFTAGTSTTTTITFTAASWAPGLWAGMENSPWDAYSTTTKLSANGSFICTSVNPTTRQVLFTGIAADITSLQTNVATAVFYIAGELTGTGTITYNCMAGLDTQLVNTGILFNIDASLYGLWKSQPFDCLNSQLTVQKIFIAISQLVGRGLDEDVVVALSPRTWSNIESDQAALREYDSSFSTSKYENGAEGLRLRSQNGTLEIVSHPYIKEGEAFIVPMDHLKRIGAADIGFTRPGSDVPIVFDLPANNAVEFRSFSHQAILFDAPARGCKMFNIVNL